MRDSLEMALLRRMLPTAGAAGETLIMEDNEYPSFCYFIRSLEESGFVFRRAGKEISVAREPDSLVPEAIFARLHGKTIGRDIVVLRETSSTNDRAKQAGIAGAAEGFAVFAERQTEGRGTYGRKWVSEAGQGLWFSVLLRSRLPPTELPRLVRLAAVASAEVIERLVGLGLSIKPPNDLVLQGGKLGGFILETSSSWDFQVLGIGINTRSAPLLPGYPTASIEDFSGPGISRNILAAGILDALEDWYFNKSPDQVEIAYQSRTRPLAST